MEGVSEQSSNTSTKRKLYEKEQVLSKRNKTGKDNDGDNNDGSNLLNDLEPEKIQRRLCNLEQKVEAVQRTINKTTIWIFAFPVDLYILQPDFSRKLAENSLVVKKFLQEKLAIPGPRAQAINFRWLGVFEQNPKIPIHQKKMNVKIDLAAMEDKQMILEKAKNLKEFNKGRRPATIIAEDLTLEQRTKRMIHHKEKIASQQKK